MLRCNWATVIARPIPGVNGPKTVAICSQIYVMACEYVNSQKKWVAGTRPGLFLIPRILNQSELPKLKNASRFSKQLAQRSARCGGFGANDYVQPVGRCPCHAPQSQ